MSVNEVTIGEVAVIGFADHRRLRLRIEKMWDADRPGTDPYATATKFGSGEMAIEIREELVPPGLRRIGSHFVVRAARGDSEWTFLRESY